jgi:hypothetical protein
VADNVNYQPAGSTPIASDDVGGVQYQRMKLTLGADGATDGDVSAANPMPVTAPSSQSSGSLAAAINSAVTVDLDGASVVTFSSPDSSGNGWAAIEMSPDGVKWVTAYGSYDSGGADRLLSNLNEVFFDDPDGKNTWTAHVAGMREARIRVVDTLDGALDIEVTTALGTRPVVGPIVISNNQFAVFGDVANSAPETSSPVSVGGYASSTAPADVSEADRVRAWHLLNGAQATAITAAGALIGGDATNGLDVDVTRLPALPAGTNNIGDVDVLTLPNVTIGTNAPLVAGTANIGDVDVLTLPALPAGNNNIGDVDVASLPALVAGSANIGDVDVLTVPSPLSTAGNGSAATAHRVTLANDSTGVVALSAAIPAGNNNIGDVDVATMPNVTIGTMAALVAGSANIGDVDVLTLPKSSTATLSNVAGSASSVTVLASNAARLGASIQNDSSAILYVKFGTTASTSSYTVQMAANSHYEVPFGYTGRIDGIWASAVGNARVTEMT